MAVVGNRGPGRSAQREHVPEHPSAGPGILRLAAGAQCEVGRPAQLRRGQAPSCNLPAQGQDGPAMFGAGQLVRVHAPLDQFAPLRPFGKLRRCARHLDRGDQGGAGPGIHHHPAGHLAEQPAPATLQQQRQRRRAGPPIQSDDRDSIVALPVVESAADQQALALQRSHPREPRNDRPHRCRLLSHLVLSSSRSVTYAADRGQNRPRYHAAKPWSGAFCHLKRMAADKTAREPRHSSAPAGDRIFPVFCG